ncbi:glycosyltransferase family 4 protein [Chelatococcus sambhunathii]|uniref:Glycosyltransferase family 4 protein n=1 Tax=Chelatococcus sambhunathii TaxID=363953 RepID=A0ABU1DDV9_9HYPH|nr:glycosyltransferase family 1 protein [Chelatococcus sambhunathii]MDR4306303.1 glycosyltransferase family 4 protein [Chelatococcus sambhunathii]
MPRTVLDVTRLLTRASYEVATGVDRVEMAYARRALAMPAERVGFAAVVGQRSVPLEADAVRSFIEALDAKWRGVAGDDAAARRLALRLGAQPPAGRPDAEAPRRHVRRLALSLKAAAAGAYLRSPVEPGDAYVHVSHIRLDRPKAFHRLAAQGARLAIMAHDLIPIRFPEYARPGEDERHRRRMTTAIETASTVIANSAETARDFLAFAAEQKLPAPPVIPALLGLEPGFAPDAPALQAARPYFLTLGTIEPRKNHLLLLHLWRRLAERMGEETPALVIVGRRGWENEMVVDLLERSPSIRRHVVEANDLSDVALTALIKGARALLFPSFSEGYGLPLAEALSLGSPALASDLAAFREIAGDRIDYLDPLDAPGWERAVLDYASATSTARADALARLAGFAAPTWEEHFRMVRDATGLD